MKEKNIVVGIDPSGIGTTGIVIKEWNPTYWPRTWNTNIEANSPVEAAIKIIEYINKVKDKYDDLSIKEVIVEVPHKGIEKWEQVKATRELVGILKYVYREKFKGHQPNHKDRTLKANLKKTKRNYSDHELDAEVIMMAHFKEEVYGWSCENFLGREKKHDKKND
ncbi:hypothetical protein mflW37_5820 [Mesoplasma florum W37]|uniref:Uncharacterized protein n=1 Tax=Mesoplasma florum TaxID=2151 RepID=A0AAD0HS83_MESFO|nr:hypothetical protein [Mesoplasma florum]AGY41649.1 hypothetical protein mflW37_5820 [Mesoplasma florum W37]AVN59853.1 hypothetical protein CG008_03080 [Mesoplasma florum]AVN65987.1 hypothetical protein MflW12_5820 [Mesoplasma florum]